MMTIKYGGLTIKHYDLIIKKCGLSIHSGVFTIRTDSFSIRDNIKYIMVSSKFWFDNNKFWFDHQKLSVLPQNRRVLPWTFVILHNVTVHNKHANLPSTNWFYHQNQNGGLMIKIEGLTDNQWWWFNHQQTIKHSGFNHQKRCFFPW